MSSFDTNQDDRGFKLFGFEIKRSRREQEKKLESVVPPADDDGAGYVTAAGAHYGTYMDLGDDNRNSKDDRQMILEYRAVSHHPEVDDAIENIVNESITTNINEPSVSIVLDNLEASENIKKQVMEEFENVLSMLNFNELGHDIFRRWYVDGRIYFHLVIDENSPKQGVQQVRPIDAAKMRKIKEIKKKKDPATGATVVEKVNEFYIFQDKPARNISSGAAGAIQGVKMSPDSIVYVTSGLLDAQRKKVVSHLHKALKTINQLRMMEDALVIYRLARAPERRVFYVDVGNLPKGKADDYMKQIMTRYRNKLVYDASTGQIRDTRKHMSMLEDFWLPRREGGRGTEVSTLPGGENLGQLDDVEYFRKKLFRALNVPINRLEQESQFSLGRSTEITRDELKFQKFIDRLRTRFNHLFLDILKKQLMLKGVIAEEDWETWKVQLQVDYSQDNHFSELKNNEVLRERIQTVDMMQPHVGVFFSKQYIQRNVLQLSDEEIEQMNKEIDQEAQEAEAQEEEQTDEIDPNQQFTTGVPQGAPQVQEQ